MGKSRPPYWLLIALVPVLNGSISAARTYVDPYARKADWQQITFTFVDWMLVAAFTPVIYLLAQRYRVKKPRVLRALLAHLLGALSLCIFWASLGLLVGWPLHYFNWPGGLLKISVAWMLVTLPWSLLLYVLMLGCMYAFIYYDEASERESQQARLATQLAEARLSALRMQLSPHLLFNTLNSITVLVRDHKTEDASQMLELLSDVLRGVLRSRKHAETTLHEELAFIEKYLTIEHVRFSDRLDIRWSIDRTAQNILVPELILQPLVENAIRHGISHRTDGGVIEIIAKESNDEIALSVHDNGPGYRASAEEGLGLANTRERLATLYGNSGRLELMPAEGGGVIATVRFPIKRGR